LLLSGDIEVKLFAITYDLRQPGRKYNELYDAIKTLAGEGNWQHPMESFWVVAISNYSYRDANSIYEEFRKYIDENDSLFVVRIDQSERQGWMPKNFWTWMKEKGSQS
jgi:hypothetical protein